MSENGQSEATTKLEELDRLRLCLAWETLSRVRLEMRVAERSWAELYEVAKRRYAIRDEDRLDLGTGTIDRVVPPPPPSS